MQFIDIHAHAYRRPVPFVVQFCSEEELLARYDAEDIRMGALLPIVSPEIYFPQANEDILDMVERHPDRFFAFCNLDPRALTNAADAPLDRVLRYYKDKGCKGVGEIMPNLRTNDPLVQNLFKHAERVGLPVTTDGSNRLGGDFGLYDEVGLPQMEESLQRFPKLDFIGHGPVFWAEISRIDRPARRKPPFFPDGEQTPWTPFDGKIVDEGVLPQLLREYGNLYGELSDAFAALARDEEYALRFLTEFQDKLFFGTDICTCQARFGIKELLLKWHDAGKLPDVVFEKIMFRNAINYFQLPE